MINKDLNQQIDQMVASPSVDLPEPIIDQPEIEQPIMADEESVFTGEEIQVAGKMKALKGILTRTPKPREIKPKAITETEKVQEMAVGAERAGIAPKKEMLEAGKLQQKLEKEPKITPQQLKQATEENIQVLQETKAEDLKPPKQAFNLPVISDLTDLQAVVKSVAELSGIETKTIKFDDVVKAAEEAGLGEKYTNDLTSGKLTVDPQNSYLTIQAMKSSADHLTDVMRKIVDNPETVTEADKLEAVQTIQFHSLLQRSVKNYRTNLAQAQAILRLQRQGFVNLEEATAGFANSEDLRRFASMYLDGSLDATGRAKLIDAAATPNFMDKVVSMWINGILSRPRTHLINSLSNFLMLPVKVAERGSAGLAGSSRKALGIGSDEQYYASEAISMARGFLQGIYDGADMAKYAWRNGYSKIDADNANKIANANARTSIFATDPNSASGAMLKGLNFLFTIPGRSLLTADEFFKGVNYRMELEALATRKGLDAFNAAENAGKSSDEAMTLMNDAIELVYENPPDDLMDLARQGTFTNKLDGFTKKFQDLSNDKSMLGYTLKLNVPFVQTPINIQLAFLERTPLAPVSRRAREAIAKGGKDRDLALTKIGLGTTFAMTMLGHAQDGDITGAGPADKKQKQALIDMGWRPYSIAISTSDFSEEEKQALSALPLNKQYGSGNFEGKVFISYQGLEPIGSFLAWAGNAADYAKYSDDPDSLNTQLFGGVYGMYDYILENAYLQGVSNVMDMLLPRKSSKQDTAEGALKNIESFFVKFGANAATPLSGLVSSFRTTGVPGLVEGDPYQREYKIDPQYANSPIAGLIQGMNEVMNKTPGLSDNLPLRLNVWGEPVEYEYAYSPLNMSEGKMNKADQICHQIGLGLQLPENSISRTIGNIPVTVKLSHEEYNNLLEIANKPPLNLKKRIIDMAPIISTMDLGEQQVTIMNVFKETFGAARDIIYANSPEIQDRIMKAYEVKKSKGLKATPPSPPLIPQ